ncbi:meprin A subunit beta-like isoform X1 [Nerophis lumbriciformis]|uniref:meprin A subunit beta-like isoform X1 n=1 Tax=Nerophis lumbriciformis TaxID=546530 RepID=UPI002AE06B5D|nr:meprin A subunit beta-like isoform X1 [Nerophis lumbriciformis]XP_061803083.1 meprin A subunit beta-like isoform X1 [Nerophis lumbriciformis]XP_061803091.1 meprin A subunit beta-like isoform X1 [Nerophis lumbriciformis]
MKGFIFLLVNLVLSTGSPVPEMAPEITEMSEDKDITEANKDLVHDDIVQFQRSAINSESRLWTSPVPYVLNKSLDMNAKGVTLRAFEQFRLKSCIDFKPRNSEKYYISVKKLNGCYSYVGRVVANGQDLSIGSNCDALSTVEHEFLHALGFYHEQSREDRDDYVTIAFENIQNGFESNFRKAENSITQGVSYDYWSVMHYGKNAFSNGIGSTIVTIDPAFQDVIGQRLEMSHRDVQELNMLYKCNSSISFMMYCGFVGGAICQMTKCSQSGLKGWQMVSQVAGGPSSDHTGLPSVIGSGPGYFMHASTASGQEGDSAWLETHRMSPSRECNVQCLQFYYYHTGSPSDQLNIWMREFDDEKDLTGHRSLVGQITGSPTSHWQIQHVSLNANTHFQVEFQVRKGAGKSAGGFSVDDINLSEMECPHVTLQINNLEKLLNSSSFGTAIYSPRQHTRGGYSYRVGTMLYKTYIGAFVQLLNGTRDDDLVWPCPHRQMTAQMIDQNPEVQLQMSKMRSLTSDPNETFSDGTFAWDDPGKNGLTGVDENNKTVFVSRLFGWSYFATLEQMKTRDFLKGGNIVLSFSFEDITPLVDGHSLPCGKAGPVDVTHPPKDEDEGPCSSDVAVTTTPQPNTTSVPTTIITTTPIPVTTHDPRESTTLPVPHPTDDSIFSVGPNMESSPALVFFILTLLLPCWAGEMF